MLGSYPGYFHGREASMLKMIITCQEFHTLIFLLEVIAHASEVSNLLLQTAAQFLGVWHTEQSVPSFINMMISTG